MADITVYNPDLDNAEEYEAEEVPNSDSEERERPRGRDYGTPSESESAAESGGVGDGDNPFSWKQPENDFTAYQKRGPKPITINWQEFDKLCQLLCTLEEIAGWFGCSEASIERAVKKEFGIKFADYFKVKSAGGKIAIRRALMQKVKEGNTAVIMYMAKSKLKEFDTPDKAAALKPGDKLPEDPNKGKDKEPDTYTLQFIGPEDESVVVQLEDDLDLNKYAGSAESD